MATGNLQRFPDLAHQVAQADRATFLLEHAVESLTAAKADELPTEKAQRLRGAAVVASQAVQEILVTCGWLEAAHAAEQNGLLEGDR